MNGYKNVWKEVEFLIEKRDAVTRNEERNSIQFSKGNVEG